MERFELQRAEKDGQIVLDRTTGLIWQQSGSPNYMNYADAEEYVRDLNAKHFAGFSDWRLPTRDEAMTILLLQPVNNFYADPVFDRTQRWIWTANKADSAGVAWVVSFYAGSCYDCGVSNGTFVRAVR